jgi:AbrB family looped-hinge helix DNA binding protein
MPRGRQAQDQNREEILDISPVSSKGQLVVPSRVRNAFNIKTGDRIAFIKRGDELILRKAQIIVTSKSPV